MLKITIHDCAQELRLLLEGRLAGPWVAELRQCWQTASSTTQSRPAVLDLREVDFVDPAGQVLLGEMYRQGVRLVADCPLIQHMVEEIGGVDCGSVERKAARRLDDPTSSDPLRRNPRAV